MTAQGMSADRLRPEGAQGEARQPGGEAMRPTYRSYRDSDAYLRSSRICPVSGEPVFPLKLLERAA